MVVVSTTRTDTLDCSANGAQNDRDVQRAGLSPFMQHLVADGIYFFSVMPSTDSKFAGFCATRAPASAVCDFLPNRYRVQTGSTSRSKVS